MAEAVMDPSSMKLRLADSDRPGAATRAGVERAGGEMDGDMDSRLVIDLRDGIDSERRATSVGPVVAGCERTSDAKAIVEQIDWIHQAGYVDAAVVVSDNLLARFGTSEDTDRLRRLVPFVSNATEIEIATETRHYRARNSGDHTVVLRIAERRRSEEMVEMLLQGLLKREIHVKGATT